MALALVVTVVSVTAAWFGDVNTASRGGFVIQSDTLQDAASIDINSSKGMTGECIYPAVAELGYLLKDGVEAPTGSVLKQEPLPDGFTEAAKAATVYFPIQVIGTPDKNFEAENRKSLYLAMQSANVGKMRVTADGNVSVYDRVSTVTAGEGETLDKYAGTWAAIGKPSLQFDGKGNGTAGGTAFTYQVNGDTDVIFTAGASAYTVQLIDYKDEFNVEVTLVEANLDENGVFESEKSVVSTTADYQALTGGAVFYECYGYNTYMLIQPGLTYYVKVVIYFNHVDEECNPDLLNTFVKFNFKLNILGDGTFIRQHEYRTEGA